jgi:pantoate kinase
MTRAKAFCPGHITGFFEIHRTSDVLSTGSRGAGLCLTVGATSSVELLESNRPKITVSINGEEQRAEVTKSAVKYLLGTDKAEVNVATTLDLPVSQGFGMSAAGSLSASVALAELLGQDRHKAFEASHIAEIECGSGLGDVSALHKGGITIRKTAGLPPIGEVLRIDGEPEVVLGVTGRKMLTRSVLLDPKKSRAINASGGRCVDQILRNRTLEELMSLSHSFSIDSGLASNEISKILDECNNVGMASMAMLGNSVFSIGNTREMREILNKHGPVWDCKVDCMGPRVL